ncbi:MAG: RnfABCDGE type electron transport complex subunit G [Candidatus Woesearchaeota archaeon]
MNDLLKSVLVLVLVTVISTSTLAFVYKFTSPLIEERRKSAYESELAVLFPGFDVVVEKPGFVEVYRSGSLVGYVVKSVAKGYAGDIVLVVGLNLEHAVVGVSVISQTETPGVGSRIAGKNFISQFVGKSIPDIALRKYGGSIDAITGATISSRALTESVRESVEKIT